MGDANINFLDPSRNVTQFTNAYNLKNMVCERTCFKSVSNPSLIDIILTNTPNRIISHLNISVGVSDFHNLVCAATRVHAPQFHRRKIVYRSYKNFIESDFVDDLDRVPFSVCTVFDDVDDVMWAYDSLLNDVVNFHAPIKSRVLKKPQLVISKHEW